MTLMSFIPVRRILKLAELLKNSPSYNSVFIAPDRTTEDEKKSSKREAVLWKRISEEPNKLINMIRREVVTVL